jgi:hypothetical protein
MLSKLIFIWVVTGTCSFPIFAQLQCALPVAEAPGISGFKLGMSYADVQQALATAIKVKPSKTGDGTVFESFAEQPAPQDLSGINAFWLRLANNKVYQVEVAYSDASGPERIEDLTARLSAQFKLPVDAWKIKNNLARLDCGEFVLTTDTILNPHVELTDTAAKAEFDKKQSAAKTPKKKKKS